MLPPGPGRRDRRLRLAGARDHDPSRRLPQRRGAAQVAGAVHRRLLGRRQRDFLSGRAPGRRLGSDPAARGPLADLRRGRGQHPRGQLHDQAPDGPQPVRGRGRRLAAAQAVREPPAQPRCGVRRLSRDADRLVRSPRSAVRGAPAGRWSRSSCRSSATSTGPCSCSRTWGARDGRGRRADRRRQHADGVAAPALAEAAKVVRAPSAPPITPATPAPGRRANWLLFLDADCAPVPACSRATSTRRRTRATGCSRARSPITRSMTRCWPATRAHATSTAASAGSRPATRVAADRKPDGPARAFEAVGGFAEGIVRPATSTSAGGSRRRGGALTRRPDAVVAHRHREDLPRSSACSFATARARAGSIAGIRAPRHAGRCRRMSSFAPASTPRAMPLWVNATRPPSGSRRARPRRSQRRIPQRERDRRLRRGLPSARLPSFARRTWATSTSIGRSSSMSTRSPSGRRARDRGRLWLGRAMPTWWLRRGIIGRVFDVFMGHRPLTGYHVYAFTIPLLLLHLPFTVGVDWNLSAELAVLDVLRIRVGLGLPLVRPQPRLHRAPVQARQRGGSRCPGSGAFRSTTTSASRSRSRSPRSRHGPTATPSRWSSTCGCCCSAVLTGLAVLAAPLYHRWYRHRRTGADDRDKVRTYHRPPPSRLVGRRSRHAPARSGAAGPRRRAGIRPGPLAQGGAAALIWLRSRS